ncbi:hypothetical protein CGZ80_10030 [Rhodopirellula sp. MGV]|nr:hypothetical protein CGZ80_10030 [Rhodopirellula sp. MGV]PNY36568.1 hypothetical protein C2E31_11980 [Rhodopirellula baltica]
MEKDCEVTSTPPSLKTPPPVGAEFPSIVVPSTVNVPVAEFQSPPPSAPATLPLTVPPVIVISALPVTCSPPPLPGAGVASGATPALLSSNATFVSVTD